MQGIIQVMTQVYSDMKASGSFLVLMLAALYVLYRVNEKKNQWFIYYILLVQVLVVMNPVVVLILSKAFPVLGTYSTFMLLTPVLMVVPFGASAIMEKAKQLNPATLNSILDKVLPYVSTSLDVEDMISVLGEATKYNIVAKDGFPFEQYRTTGNLGKKGSCVIPVDLKTNVMELHKFLFESEEYEISSEVQSYSQKISADTGR